MQGDKNHRVTFLLVACTFELSLAFIALFWIRVRPIEVSGFEGITSITLGIALAVPMLLLNGALYYCMIKKNRNSPYGQFFFEFIVPLCRHQNLVSALCTGIASGLGEELFFRGAFTSELALHMPLFVAVVLINIVFAYVHFVGSARRFARLLFFYFLFGVYFSFIVEFYQNLWAAVVCHAVYNTIVIIFVQKVFGARNKENELQIIAV